MKRVLILSFIACLSLTASALDDQTKNAPRLIVRADDIASSRAANIACMQTALDGITTSIEVMVVCPWFPEAAKLLNDNPTIDVGLHLTITSEWENIKWRPLTNCPSLTDANGYFYPMISPNASYPGQSITENKADRDGFKKHSSNQPSLRPHGIHVF